MSGKDKTGQSGNPRSERMSAGASATLGCEAVKAGTGRTMGTPGAEGLKADSSGTCAGSGRVSVNGRRSMVQFVKFALVGGMNTGVDFLLFTGLLWTGIHYMAAQCVSYAAGTLNSYLVNKFWTFQARGGGIKGEFAKFALLNMVTLMMTLGLLYLCTDVAGLHPLLSKLLVTGASVVVNFIGSKLWVFQEQEE